MNIRYRNIKCCDMTPHPNALNQLELWTETSKDILRQAYEDMDRSSHHWAAHTQHEIDYLVKNNYITKTNEILSKNNIPKPDR